MKGLKVMKRNGFEGTGLVGCRQPGLLAERNRGLLAGMWFHSRKDGKIEWQGTVLRDLGNGGCLVQLFEWAMGTPTVQKVVTFEQMKSFDFYPTDLAMRWAYHTEMGGSNEDWESEMRMVELMSRL